MGMVQFEVKRRTSKRRGLFTRPLSTSNEYLGSNDFFHRLFVVVFTAKNGKFWMDTSPW